MGQPASTYAMNFRMAVNGKDAGIAGAVWVSDNVGQYLTPLGTYFSAAASGTAQAWFANLVGISGQQKTFAQGTYSSPGMLINNQLSNAGQSYLDINVAAASAEGQYIRYTPSRLSTTTNIDGRTAYSLGTWDYGVTPGTDRSASVVFIEGDNLIDASIEPNAEFFATKTRAVGVPLNDSGGTAEWINVISANTYGIWEDNTPIVGPTDWTLLRRAAATVIANKTNLNNAKTITVARDPQTADVWRELDYVTVHAPTIGLNHVKALVMAYDFTEGSQTQTLWLDQFAKGAYSMPARRLGTAIEYGSGSFGSR